MSTDMQQGDALDDAERKLRADADLAEENVRKARLDNLKSWGTLLVSVCAALGVFTVFCYCEYQANFFPSGLNVGDTLFFVFVALGFGAVYLIWIFLGYMAARGPFVFCAWWKNRGAKTQGANPRRSESGWDVVFSLFAFLVGICSVFFIAWASSKPDPSLDQFVKGFVPPLFSGLMLWFLLDSETMQPGRSTRSKSDLSKFRAIFFLLALALPLFLGIRVTAAIQRMSLGNLGVYADRAELIATDDEFKVIRAAALRLNIPIFSCTVDGTDDHIVSNVRLWWNGIGDRTLIGIPNPKASDEDAVRIELKRDGLRVVRPGKEQGIAGCFPLATAMWFDHYQDELTESGKADLASFAQTVGQSIAGSNLKVREVFVTGHADRSPVLAPKDDNTKLSERRAAKIGETLRGALSLKPDIQVHTTGVGSRDNTARCDSTLRGAALSDCLAPDRRVDIRLVLIRNS